MPFIFLFVGIVLIITGLRGTIGQLGALLKNDFTGKNNFGIWVFAFLVIGAVGYVPSLKKLSDSFLLLVIIVIFIVNDKNGHGFFTNLSQTINGLTPSNSSLGASNLQTGVTSNNLSSFGFPTSLYSGGIFQQGFGGGSLP